MTARKVRVRYQRAWRNKPHPYWFARRWETMSTLQVGPLEIFIRRGGAA